MADEKWIVGLHGTMLTSEAASKVLALRLGVVRDRLPDAVFHAEGNIDYVHALRVSTRRAAAALRIFQSCLPERTFKKARKSLRMLRRSAGAARDWDVFLEMLQTRAGRADTKQRRGLDFLLGFAHAQRVLAQAGLVEFQEQSTDRFARCVEQVQYALTAPAGGATLNELAVPMLTELLRELDTAARGTLQDYDSLHQVRILGKQLRYAMEIFETCFAPDFRSRYYPAIVEMQDILGLANDSHVACERLETLRTQLMRSQSKHWLHYQAGIDVLVRFHERRLPEQRRKFEKWWQAWATSGAEQGFVELVKGT